jgi:hypothetical protein
VGGDDNNYAKLVPSSTTFVTYCSWINAAMNKYVQAHPNYSFSWSGGQNQITQNVLGDLNVTTYEAWAGTSPDVTGGDGVKRNKGYVNAEAGGADLVFTYTPKNQGDPTNVRFIQACNESLTGSPYQIYLDNGPSATPFYDDRGISGTAANGGQLANDVSWFQDRPLDTEPRLMARVPTAEGPNEIDTYSDVQFQVVVAVDNGPIANTAITDNITLYGGLWWGYNYWNNDNVTMTALDPNIDPLNTDSETYTVSAFDDPNGPLPDGVTSVPEPTGLFWATLMIPLAARRRRDARIPETEPPARPRSSHSAPITKVISPIAATPSRRPPVDGTGVLSTASWPSRTRGGESSRPPT